MNTETTPIRLNPECIKCIIDKQLKRVPESTPKEVQLKYMQSLLKIIADAPMTMSSPEIVGKISTLHNIMFGADNDYTETKRYFNDLMLKLEMQIRDVVNSSADSLKTAVQYAMTGNYIDFAAMDNVSEDTLMSLLNQAQECSIDENELSNLQNDIIKAEKIVYLTDNCGEIVLDKVLVSAMKEMNPKADITVIVRGEPVVNDADMSDAMQVKMTDIAKVLPNGSAVAGTCLNDISDEAVDVIHNADVIISKGQGNFETLQKCGLNVYYIFMCKCKMFSDRFNVPRLSGILVNDKTVCKMC